ncbi:MAG: hypothetical protein CMJ31_00605 [Phycisphaerae bacterium]|nr:hypothetical protein [Phycisphaerae bacterium]
MSEDKVFLGVDLGGTNIQMGLVSEDGQVLTREKARTDAAEGRDAVLGRIVEGVNACCEDQGISLKDVTAMGIGVPGPVDYVRGVVVEAVNLGWSNEPIGEMLAQRLGIPVTLDNDVNVALYGEWKHGAARGANDVLGAWVGTGVGGAFILNGALYNGHFQTAGEIGHMIISPDNPPGVRSLEHNCSRTAICNRLRQLIEASRESVIPSLVDGKLHKIKSKIVAEAYGRGDELTVEVVHDAAERLGVVLGSLVTALSLGRIVLGGGLTEAMGAVWVEQVRAAVHRVAFPVTTRDVEVVATELLDNAGVIGAALLAKQRVLEASDAVQV